LRTQQRNDLRIALLSLPMLVQFIPAERDEERHSMKRMRHFAIAAIQLIVTGLSL
jgi:hypothetical protein